MKDYYVSVEKTHLTTGKIKVEAENPEDAQNIIDEMIFSGALQTISPEIEWDEPEYEEFSFQTTGDID